MRDYDNALRSFDKTIELDKNYRYTYGYRGDVYRNLGKYEDAI